jgi:hypothetical protein
MLSSLAAVLGVLAVLAGVVGRFWGAGPSVTIPFLGGAHNALTLLVVGNTLLLVAIYLAVAVCPRKQQ